MQKKSHIFCNERIIDGTNITLSKQLIKYNARAEESPQKACTKLLQPQIRDTILLKVDIGHFNNIQYQGRLSIFVYGVDNSFVQFFMKNTFTLFLFLSLFLLTSCLQNDDSDARIPVRYTVIVTDKISGKAVEKAKVELTNEVQSAQSLTTNSSGTVIFPSEESYVNQIVITKDGYFPKDTVDVISNPDTALSVILRSISIFLVPTDTAKVDSTKK
jgi:hypothetical protein